MDGEPFFKAFTQGCGLAKTSRKPETRLLCAI